MAFYLRDSLRAAVLLCSEETYYRKPEYIFAKITASSTSSFLLGIVYRPPNCGYMQDFQNTFLELQGDFQHSIMLGDFNADMNRDTYDSSIMYNFIESGGLHLVPHGDTHHLRTSSSFLDLCIIDDRSKLIDYG